MCNLMHINDYELNNFIGDANVDHFINSIRGGNEDPICNFDSYFINDCFFDNKFQSCHGSPIFDHQTNNNSVNVYDPILSSTLSHVPHILIGSLWERR
ncbi:hypothetical protein Lalb_Chr14g0374421 [Lupinus albus]|uniref:Uncharacterized protein n=1 Tax=Lupinus albus TaxID=3870 RepID=A0A6A4PGI4_LUPAL|nr:hypothetical protein Lalb_Chr14g0374421 [Lupinus albus]